jgi:hypothetical protein
VRKQKTVSLGGYRNVILKNNAETMNRVMIGVPMTGLLRSEWVLARYGLIIPCNWSHADVIQFIESASPIGWMVADARNIIVKSFIERNYEWLIFVDHDVILPPFFNLIMNEYMIKKKVPIMSGLYFTKSVPSEPLIYRGRGNSYYDKWKLDDKVWVDGIPMGCTLIHRSVLQVVWDESPEYSTFGQRTRRVFETPARIEFDPETHLLHTRRGTEDLELCSRIMKEKVFEKAGWPEYQKKKYPFLVDTRLFCKHIDMDGIQYPSRGEHMKFARKGKKRG